MYWPHFMEQIRGRHYHHQKPPTKASHRLAGHEWPTDHPWPGTLLKSLPRRPLVLAMSPRGLFHQHPASSPKIYSQKIQGRKSPLRWEPQAEILHACPKHVFGHTYKVPAWNPHKRYDFRTTQTSRGHYESLVKHPWLVGVQCTHCPPHQPGECCLVACSSTKPHSPRGHGNQECNKVCQSDKVVIGLQK